ncbi:MAG TPA: DNA mismatch repair protein MutS [Myxococcota bacterium]|nr:DNA mismatch repair protein MutS [Myxococcota bacterium]
MPTSSSDTAGSRVTPMMRQYLEAKGAYPDCLVLFRVGDFYETFFDDAVAASRALDITLTAREKGVPMAGVPHHAVQGYIARLLEGGFKVAVVDQVEEPAPGKKIFRREVTRVVTPGVALDDDTLEARAPNYLMAVAPPGAARTGDAAAVTPAWGVAYLDASTGEFFATELPGARAANGAEGGAGAAGAVAPALPQVLLDELARVRPREILYPASAAPVGEALKAAAGRAVVVGTAPDEAFAAAAAAGALAGLCAAGDGLDAALQGLREHAAALGAAGACAAYLERTQARRDFGVAAPDGSGQGETASAAGVALAARSAESDAPPPSVGAVPARERERERGRYLQPPRLYGTGEFLVLDEAALTHLEVTRTIIGGRRQGSLLGVLDLCATSMGSRLLQRWLTFPLRDPAAIDRRLDAVEELREVPSARADLFEVLGGVADMERLNARVSLGAGSPRDLGALRDALRTLPRLGEKLAGRGAALFGEVAFALADSALAELEALLGRALVDAPPAALGKGPLIRPRYHEELDQLVALRADSKGYILGIEARERKRTGIGSLKVGYNKVFGYYLEVTRANLAAVPPDYVRRQTLTNAERYVTEELKEYEHKVLGADERIDKLESELFGELRRAVAGRAAQIGAAARAVAQLDVVTALAEAAHRYGYCRPVVGRDAVLSIDEGRHPVVERLAAAGSFVPNDVRLDPAAEQVLILTGPNMAGKSTILRQTALIALMAQAGSFVPARGASLPALDRIFTRVGAGDDLSRARSTFMVEMMETASILAGASPRSLVVLDEIGRGTSTFDGLSIAWAVAEHLHDRVGALTLFATHYHELCDLAERCARVRNFQVLVREWQGDVVFLHKLAPGGANRSYGIQVARLAGLPAAVVARAKEVLSALEAHSIAADAAIALTGGGAGAGRGARRQLQLFTPEPAPPPPAAAVLVERLSKLDPDTLSPREALEELYTLARLAKDS